MFAKTGIVDARERLNRIRLLVDRTLTLSAHELLSQEQPSSKILIGTFMGHVALLGQSLDERKSELLEVENFEHALEDMAIVTGDLCEYVNQLQIEVCSAPGIFSVADEPTSLILERLNLLLSKWQNQILHLPQAATKFDYQGRIFPSRPPSLNYAEEKIFSIKSVQDLMTDQEQWRRFLHYVYIDVEIAAMEVCALMMLQNPSMPARFRRDMARQIWDEGRHAILIEELLNDAGGSVGDYTYNAQVIKRFYDLDSLETQLASQQVIQEGNALEMNVYLIDAIRDSGLTKAADYFDFINADECEHVKFGNYWLKYLTGQEEDFMVAMQKASEVIQIPVEGKGGWNPVFRRLSGSPDFFIQKIEQRSMKQ